MIGKGSSRPDKGKGVAKPKKRQRTPSYSSTTDPCPPPIADTLPPPVVITSTPPPDPTSRPSSSSIPASETATTSADLDSAGDVVDPPLHDRPWIEPFGRGWTSTFGTLYSLIGVQQNFAIRVLEPKRTELLKRVAPCIPVAQALGRAVHVDEIFALTHVRKGTTEFVDERSQKTHNFLQDFHRLDPNMGQLLHWMIFKHLFHRPSDPAMTLPFTRRPSAAHINLTDISPAHTSPAIYKAVG
ncbi:hypothetical protein LR48_Vigan107s000800 [Vigna angularis]|uniref:Uncharacterized protein n=1 Tax=Phaseolus angularis TaxID=3914 RepID=A0A0L9T5V1_PHAAN|nr:hypothetical protein LR48_Vigan107s000800 [Vigna angularis]